jgi:hypothetical protein
MTSFLSLAEAVPKGMPSCSCLRWLTDIPISPSKHVSGRREGRTPTGFRDGYYQAGEVGFEPTGVLPPLVFKTSAFVRSAIPPCAGLYDLFSSDGWGGVCRYPGSEGRGGCEGEGLGAGDRLHCFAGGKEPRVMERQGLCAGGVLEPDEHHQRRRQAAVEAEVV